MILFIAAGLMMMTNAQANENLVNKDNLKGELTRYRNAQPVLFALNGIDYAVYPVIDCCISAVFYWNNLIFPSGSFIGDTRLGQVSVFSFL